MIYQGIRKIAFVVLSYNHYFSFVCDYSDVLQSVKLILFDSLYSHNVIVRRTIETMMKILSMRNGINHIDVQFEMKRVPVQQDYTSCAPFTLYFSEKHFNEQNKECDCEEAMKMREKLKIFYYSKFRNHLN